jgi:tetratricopeptide (TPR) repeat protein
MRSRLSKIRAAAMLAILLSSVAVASDYTRAVALYTRGDYSAALAEFQDVTHDRPGAAAAWYYIGLCEYHLKRYDRVELPLRRAIDLLEIQDPDSKDIAGAHFTIGLSHYLAGRYDRAVEPLKKYMELTGKARREVDPHARAALARSYFFLERYDEAIPLFGAAKSIAPGPDSSKDAAANSYYLGVIYFKREDDDRSIAALRDALKQGFEEEAAMELLAESLMRKARKSASNGAWMEAAEVAERLRQKRDDLKTAALLGRAYFGAQQFDRAVAPLEKVARAKTEDGQSWLFYGIALSRSNQLRKAMEALEITIQLMPDSVPALSELAYVYELDKQYQQALRIYEKAYAVTGDPAVQKSIERVRALAAQQP